MKRIVLSALLVGISGSMLGMETLESNESDLEPNKTLSNTEPLELRRLEAELFCLASDKTMDEIEQLQQIDESDIVQLIFSPARDEKFTNAYHATLKNGDTITASCFVKEPIKGNILVRLTVLSNDGDLCPLILGNSWFARLKSLYEKQNSTE